MSTASTLQLAGWMRYLRPSPIAAEAALRVLAVGELDAETLALVIGSDAGLSAAIVRATEPAEMGASVASRIASLSPARLHSALFPSITSALMAGGGSSICIEEEPSWRLALATAITAESISRECGCADPNAAYLAGLLHKCTCDFADNPEQGPRSLSPRAIGRKYRFPTWLLDSLEAAESWEYEDEAGLDGLRRVLALAALFAPGLAAPKSADSQTLANAAKRYRINPRSLEVALDTATASFERRLSLFAFTPAPLAEMQSSLLRFANHLLLYWRVDETSAIMLRKRAEHATALLRLSNASDALGPLQDVLLTCADGLRAALSIPSGLVVAWTDDAAPIDAVRWSSVTGFLEPLSLDAEGGAAGHAIQRFLAHDMWSASSGETAIPPTVVPVISPAQQHAGYLIVTVPASSTTATEQLGEWVAFLGRAIERVHAAERDDIAHDALRRRTPVTTAGTREPSEPTIDFAAQQRNIARATIAALHGPLSTITAQAQQLVSRSANGEFQENIEDVARNARNAARVVADLRVLAGDGDVPNEFILINAPLRQFLHSILPRLQRRSIRLTENLADGLPRIRADVRKLQHLFTNLLSYIEQRLGHSGRTIEVSSRPSDDRSGVIVTFEVSGIAIPEEAAARLFAPFDNYEHASNEFALALGACSAIVKEIGGSIRIRPTGDGAVFIITFDAVHAVLAVEPAPSAVVPAPVEPPRTSDIILGARNGDRPCVLIVDDDDVMVDLMKQALLRRNYDVEIAKDGNEASQSLESVHIDVVLLDLLMPNRDGIAVLRDLKDRRTAPPVIVMTGSRAPDAREEAMLLGAQSFLQKPFALSQLLHEIESVLARVTV